MSIGIFRCQLFDVRETFGVECYLRSKPAHIRGSLYIIRLQDFGLLRPPALAESCEPVLVELIMATHAGMTVSDFSSIVTDWLATACAVPY